MSDNTPPLSDITEQDVVFECPHCGKSLAIDRRGSGLTIACPGCQTQVRVPVPHDVKLRQAVQTLASLAGGEASVEELTDALKLSESRVLELASNLSELTAQRRELEKLRRDQAERIARLRKEFTAIQESLDRIAFVLEDGAPE
jgi:predicted  nucleic acid-binding Zn-ribbon protein